MKQVPLEIWAAWHFAPPPARRTLRKWAKEGRIYPQPVIIGREYRVREDAEYVPPVREPRLQPVTVLSSEDPIVNEILSNGPTPQRRTP